MLKRKGNRTFSVNKLQINAENKGRLTKIKETGVYSIK